MSFDELFGIALTLYILVSVLAGVLRGGGRRAPGGPAGDDRPVDWEEELRRMFEDRAPAAPEDSRPLDDRPWLEVEPIPPGPGYEVFDEVDDHTTPSRPPERPAAESAGEGLFRMPAPAEDGSPGAEPDFKDGVGDVGSLRIPAAAFGDREPVSHREPSSQPVPERRAAAPVQPAHPSLPIVLPSDPAGWGEAVLLAEILDQPRCRRPYRPPVWMIDNR